MRRANDPWTQLLTPPPHNITPSEIIATFGAQVTPLLSEPSTVSSTGSVDSTAVEEAYARAEAEGRTRRPAQEALSYLAADTLQSGGYAIIEAGTGIGKSQGYLIPAALSARANGRPVAVSTFTRILQEQLVTRELPFIQQLVPGISYAQLQGRANYLSLSRLAEEVEDALAEASLAIVPGCLRHWCVLPPRAHMATWKNWVLYLNRWIAFCIAMGPCISF